MLSAVKEKAHIFAIAIASFVGLSSESASLVYVFLISMIPIVELRGALPVAAALRLPVFSSYIAAVLGNLLPVPFILLLITPVCNLLKKTKVFAWFPRLVEKKVEKNRAKVEKYARWGLFLFVAIPLPGTGAWTGALVASFLEFKFKDAIISIIGGVLTAGVIMAAVSYGVLGLIF
ncbi:MAG: small multi-drug export protein [Clostridia bacterium]|nr:small multi-drug export protein [Clostridia bacterium]